VVPYVSAEYKIKNVRKIISKQNHNPIIFSILGTLFQECKLMVACVSADYKIKNARKIISKQNHNPIIFSILGTLSQKFYPIIASV
jgi:hypothetical protein